MFRPEGSEVIAAMAGVRARKGASVAKDLINGGSAKKGDSVTEDLIAGVSAKKGDSTARKSDSAIEGLIAAGMSYVCSTARRLVWHVV
jgi:hypothetical protein